jgi:riboflavin synthase
MFTGIVEERGEVRAVVDTGDGVRLEITAAVVTEGTRPGDSVAVSGVCLTVTEVGDGALAADVISETLRRSALADLRPGEPVNLERAVTLADRFGGHLVQGHVDGTGDLLSRTADRNGEVLRIGLPPGLGRYVVQQGSVTVDGVSLTVSAVTDEWFEVSLIPTTLAVTTLGAAQVGSRRNLEVDVLAKYVEKLLGVSP